MTNQNTENGATPDRRHEACRHALDNAEAFALGALDRTENSRIEQHLILCGACRRGIAEIRRVTNLLPFLAESAMPSPSVKTKLLARIGGTHGPAPRPAMMNPWSATTAVAAAAAAPARVATAAKGAPQRMSWQRWLPPALLAPLAIALLIMAAWANSLSNEVDYLEADRASHQSTSGIASDANMQLYSFKPACPTCNKASGRFGGDPNGSVGLVVAWNLDPNEQHQVWCVDNKGEKWMVTNLEVAPSGDVVQTISFPQPLSGYQQIYVARHDGTANPDAEMMVAMHEPTPADQPATETTVPAGN